MFYSIQGSEIQSQEYHYNFQLLKELFLFMF